MISRSPVARPRASFWRWTLTVLLVVLGSVSSASAQGHKVDTNQFWMQPYGPIPSTPPYTQRPLYGLNPDEFWIGVYSETRPDDGNWHHFWDWCDTMGFRIIEHRGDLRWAIRDSHPDVVDSLIDAAKPYDTAFSGWRQRVIPVVPWMSQAGFSTEMVLFPFDSAANYYYQHRFLSQAGGVRAYNANQHDDWDRAASEQVYDTLNTTPGTEIAASMILGADTTIHTRRWRVGAYDIQVYPRNFSPYKPTIPDEGILQTIPVMPKVDGMEINFRRIYIVVRGHLFDGNNGGRLYGVGTSDTLLEIQVYDEVQDSMYYRPHLDSALRRAVGPTSRLYKTLYLTKGMIRPPVDPATFPLGQQQQKWDEYREVVFAVDMVSDPVTRVTGPWDTRKAENSGPYGQANSHGRDFDLRVKWTGKEKLALRAVVLRDSLAELVHQTGGQNDTLRHYALNYTYRVLRGAAWGIGSPAPSVDSVLERRRRVVNRIHVGDEGDNPTSSGFNWADSLLYRTFGSVTPDPDSSLRGLRGWRGNNGRNVHPWMASTSEITPEVYYPKVDNPDTAGQKSYTQTYFGVDLGNAPSIREHNGGRFLTPELGLTDDSIRMGTRLLQRMTIGQALPEPQFWPQQTNVSHLYEGARKSRATGHPLLMWAGSMVRFFLKNRRIDSVTVVRDTMLGHLQEAADYRMLVNLGLCYGTRGIHYSYLGFNQNQYAGRDLVIGSDTTYYAFDGPDLGMVGRTTSTDTINHTNMVFYTDPWLVPQHRDTIPNLYTGWKNQTRAVKWLNREWIPAVWQYLKRLRWREGYSAHFTVQQNFGYFTSDTAGEGALAGAVIRPFPATEIVQGIQTYDRLGRLDSAQETYVEVGLFDSIPGSGGYDTNHIMLCQRRTFERPDDISPGSARGKLMDSLAEWRRVVLRLNLPHPDSTSYNYLRVRELAADTTRAPWDTVSRRGLDTVVHADSLVSLWMRPGGGALLRLTYVEPGDTLHGNLTYNNGRKLMFSGNRYFAVYSLFDDVPPNTTDTTSSNDAIWLRWSQPVDSVERAVRWSGPGSGKVLVSTPAGGKPPFIQNRHPSLTVRQVGDTSRIVVTWTAHSDSTAYGNRMVLAKTIRLRNLTGTTAGVGAPAVVAYYHGSWLTPWGTPVVSTLHGAELFAWSDSMAGVIARLRVSDPTQFIYPSNPWSNYDTVAKGIFCPGTIPGMFPTVPPLAHITSLDSSVGLAWQQSRGNCIGGGPANSILYKRMIHVPGGGGTPILLDTNLITLTPTVANHYHPSMDLWQDVWYQCFEGVAWETLDNTKSYVWFRPVSTETRLRGGWNPFWDSVEVSNGWAWYEQVVHTGDVPAFIWPNAAALNEVYDLATQNDTGRFAIAYLDTAAPMPGSGLSPTHDLWQVRIWYGMSSAVTDYPKRYSFDGDHPAVSSSPIRQDLRAATLYESDHDANQGNAVVNPTHQFFSRLARPRGYLAVGRQVILLDTFQTGATARIGEVWVSDEDSSRALEMTPRASTHARIDSIGGALALARSATFTTHDSAEIGLHAEAQLAGDSAHAVAQGMEIHLRWELVESSGGTVVALLDSATINAAHPRHDSLVTRIFDLVSGIYEVRMTADTISLAPRPLGGQESRWPVAETAVWIESLSGKLVRTGEEQGNRARLDVQPNPASDRAEVLVSVAKESKVRITLTSIDGRTAGMIYEGILDRGRYSVPVQLANLRPGAYLVELVAGRKRLVQKLVVR